MKKRASAKNPSRKASRSKKGGTVIGRERFAKISAVEGITLSPAMRARAAEFDRTGRSAEERRSVIIQSYRKG
jgi:hypothetical protein